MSNIRAAIVGYGNLGKSVEKIIAMQPDMELVGIFSRRAELDTEAPVFPVEEIGDYADRVVALVSTGWDPGMFSLNRTLAEARRSKRCLYGPRGRSLSDLSDPVRRADCARRLSGNEQKTQDARPSRDARPLKLEPGNSLG